MEDDPIPIRSPIFIDSLIESINKISHDSRAYSLEAFIAEIFDGIELDLYTKVGILEKLKIYFQNDCIWNDLVISPKPN